MYVNRQIVLGVSALVYLAQVRSRSATRSQLADALDVSDSVIGLVLWKLRLAGLVDAEDGASHRYRFTQSARETSVSDIFDAMDDERPWRRLEHPATADRLGRLEGPDLVWSGAEACLRLFLGDMTLADIARGASRFDASSLQVFRRAGGLPDWSAEHRPR
jgi:DNA-binding IscR family transcriptional regulator